MENLNIREIELNQIRISDSFWSPRQKLVTDVVIPYQEKIMNDEIKGAEKSHALTNFRIAAGLEKGEFYGMVFQDSDVAKWLEAVAYSLSIKPDVKLEQRADAVISIIAKAQWKDGYLNTYFTIKAPEKRWQNLLECHELYCAGHMMEAAAAYYKVTGKEQLLHVMERMAEHIEEYFVAGKHDGIPGHQEIEIGLMKLYHATGKEKYMKLSLHFINQRGEDPEYFIKETKRRGWKHEDMDPQNTRFNQSYAPVREQTEADGHSVRAVYMYTAMADLAAHTQDEGLLRACETIWENMVSKRMYITGGIGSNADGEAFTIDYDLPNDSVYAETCASVGLIFWAKKMLDIKPCGQYADIMERALYNGVLSGMQLDGKRFFYVNPLEVNPDVSGKLSGFKHVLPERPGWYQCACCPPNVARLLTSLGQYAWSEGYDIIYSHLHIGGEVSFPVGRIVTVSELPWQGKITYTVYPVKSGQEFTLAMRIPEYAKDYRLLCNGDTANASLKNGYAYIGRQWKEGEEVQLEFDMPVRRMYTNTSVRANIGCTALMRGPLVYCFEEKDNGVDIQEMHIVKGKPITAEAYRSGFLGGIIPLTMKGKRLSQHRNLYIEDELQQEELSLTAIPYYAWGNRGLNQMRVWMHEMI